MKLNKATAIVLVGTFIGVTGYSATIPTQVQAKASYKVQITKNAYVYTSKGKKSKTAYKKNKVLTAYKVRKIKGKYYYDLGKGKYVRTNYAKKYYHRAKKYYYRTTTQSKKLVRTIKLYQPTGKKTVKQNAYVKRTVKTNLKTGTKTYGKWGSASWKVYKVPAVSGYTASPKQVAKEKVYSWSKNKTVMVKYKKNSSKQAAQPSSLNSSALANDVSTQNDERYSQGQNDDATNVTNKSDTTDENGTTSVNAESASESSKSSVSESKKVNPWTEEDSTAIRQGVLKVINDFRSQVGLPAVTLNNDFNDTLDARSLEKSKFCSQNGDVNHDGDSAIYTVIHEKTNLIPVESLDPVSFYDYDSDKEQIDVVINKYRDDMQGEKDDYEAIYINHTRKNITNYSGTVGHYGSLINGKIDSDSNWTANATQVAIGVACYGPSGVTDSTYYEKYSDSDIDFVTLVIEMLCE